MATHAPRPSPTPPGEDWHPADIIAALRKAGWSLRRLSVHHGYGANQLSCATSGKHFPKGERLIADAIGVPAETIWPSRYAIRAARKARLSKRALASRARHQALAGVTSPSPSTTSLDGAA